MKLKRFKQFVNKINEDVVPQEKYDSLEDFKKELPEDELAEDDFDFDDEEDLDSSDELSEDPNFEEPNLEGEEEEIEGEEEEIEGEEEGGEYEGAVKMKELASKLGVEVKDNVIDYNGQKINFYSETEMFHIGKKKFKTVDEVLDFLKPEESQEELVDDELEEPVLSESKRHIKRF